MSKPFTLTQLRYFAVVAELQNMTAAASALNITQPALSTAMSQLQAALSTQLLVRQRPRGVRLTPSGRQLAQDIKSFLEQADSLYESVNGMSASLSGELKVGVFAPLAPFRLPTILQAFEAAHPEVSVSIVEADLARLQEALLAGQCDVALMYGLGLGHGFTYEVLERIPPHVLLHHEHPLAVTGRRRIALRELESEPSIVLDLPHSREYYERLYQSAGMVPRVRHRFSGYETVRSFVAKGHGYAVLNQRLRSDTTYSGGHVTALELSDEFPPIEVMLVRPEGVQATRRTVAFEDTCRLIYGSETAHHS